MNTIQELRSSVSRAPAEPAPDKPQSPKPPARISWHLPVAFLLGAALGIGAGIALGWYVLPRAFAPAAPKAETVQAADHGDLVASGGFIQADPNDPLHRGAGGVSVYDGEVVFDADFQVPPGPDYRVLLVPKPAIRAAGDIAKTMYVDLGPLTAFKGSQHYKVPAGVDLADYPSVVIWCRAYSLLIAPADLCFAKTS